MKITQTKIILLSVIAVLIIGIIIPKLTVWDVVPPTDEEKRCVLIDIQQQLDHPLQRIALFLGKSAVVGKQGDGIIKEKTLIVKSYTIFRIPLPTTRFFNQFTQHSICDWGMENIDGDSTKFAEKIQRLVVENFGRPIDSGFTAPMYLRAFPGLLEADFDGVETSEGKYIYLDNEITFTRKNVGYISTFDEAILEKGHKTILNNLRARLGSNLSVDEIITRITDDADTPFVSAGDTLGAMIVVSVAPFNSGQYSTDPNTIKTGPRNVKITLTGPIEITGTYNAVHSAIGFDGYCMSVFDATSLSRLPSLPVRGGPADIRSHFCFRNADLAQQQLGEESRTVTVLMDNYELNSYPAEVVDWADLVEVVRE